MSTYYYIACDLGAESGRVMLGTLEGQRLTLEEIHRFPNGPVAVCGSLRWDVLRLFDELKAGLRKVAARGVPVAGISTDSWGVDYVLLKGNEPMLTAPYQYRDARTDPMLDEAAKTVSLDTIFNETGIQFMTINTLYQLLADLKHRPEILRGADAFLNIGDYFNYLFSGVAKAEESLASTTQVYNPTTKGWSKVLIDKFGLPGKVFPQVVPSGTVLGPLLPSVATETGLQNVRVVASCSHDTGAAVAATPAEGNDWAYLSSGTWSLLGIESPKPIINAKSRQYNFTNEVGFGSSIRFLKNIVGLWILQESRRAWAKEGTEYNYDQLVEIAAKAPALQCLINPAAARFLKPDNMPQKIADYCRETGQPVPQSHGQTVRCILESLALLYGKTIHEIADASGQAIKRLHILGGGSRNKLLNQWAANATGLTVITGPVEATSAGNILVQAIALGHIKSLAELRSIVRASFPVDTFTPQDAATWKSAQERFAKLTLAT
jgi:rhamnulokinase